MVLAVSFCVGEASAHRVEDLRASAGSGHTAEAELTHGARSRITGPGGFCDETHPCWLATPQFFRFLRRSAGCDRLAVPSVWFRATAQGRGRGRRHSLAAGARVVREPVTNDYGA